jgi:hypothetical protein
MRYKTLAEVVAAYKSGELTTEAITLDNDSTNLWVGDDDCEVEFSGGTPDELLEAALELLGVRWENA